MTWSRKHALVSLAWLIGAAVLLPQTATGQDKERKREIIEKLQGVWINVAADIDGKFTKLDEPFATASFDRVSVVQKTGDKKFMQKGTWKIIDVQRKYFKVDYDITGGAYKGETLVGIARMERDELKFCYRFASAGAGRPDEFVTKKGDGVSIYIFKRKRK